MQGFLQDGNLRLDLSWRRKCPVCSGQAGWGMPLGSAVQMLTLLLLPTCPVLHTGPGAELQQPGGWGRRHRALVGRMDQVDGVYQDLRGRCEVPGAALPAAEVRHPPELRHPPAGLGAAPACWRVDLVQEVVTQQISTGAKVLSSKPACAEG